VSVPRQESHFVIFLVFGFIKIAMQNKNIEFGVKRLKIQLTTRTENKTWVMAGITKLLLTR
jgi:hypothetical protein